MGNYIVGILLMLFVLYSILPTIFYVIHKWWKRRSRDSKVLYLTFEDGPSLEYTTELLDLLRRYEIKATFFVVASKAYENEVLIRRMRKEGHSIQLHGLDHTNPLFLLPNKERKELVLALKIMTSMKVNVTTYRPAYGCINLYMLRILKQQGIKISFCDLFLKGRHKKRYIESIFSKAKKGGIICLHDGKKKSTSDMSLELLKVMLPVWSYQGYQFKKIG